MEVIYKFSDVSPFAQLFLSGYRSREYTNNAWLLLGAYEALPEKAIITANNTDGLQGSRCGSINKRVTAHQIAEPVLYMSPPLIPSNHLFSRLPFT